jgi:hypothetical protein
LPSLNQLEIDGRGALLMRINADLASLYKGNIAPNSKDR